MTFDLGLKLMGLVVVVLLIAKCVYDWLCYRIDQKEEKYRRGGDQK